MLKLNSLKEEFNLATAQGMEKNAFGDWRPIQNFDITTARPKASISPSEKIFGVFTQEEADEIYQTLHERTPTASDVTKTAGVALDVVTKGPINTFTDLDSEQKQALFKTLGAIGDYFGRVAQGMRAGVGAMFDREDPVQQSIYGFFKPEEVQKLVDRVPFQEFEQNGIASLVPRALIGAIEDYIFYGAAFSIKPISAVRQMRVNTANRFIDDVVDLVPAFEKAGVRFPADMEIRDKALKIIQAGESDRFIGDGLSALYKRNGLLRFMYSESGQANIPIKTTSPILKRLAVKGVRPVAMQGMIRLLQDTVVRDASGAKVTLPAGEEYKAIQLSNNQLLLQDGDEIVVQKGPFQDVKNRNLALGEKKFMTPQEEGLEEVVKGAKERRDLTIRKQDGNDFLYDVVDDQGKVVVRNLGKDAASQAVDTYWDGKGDTKFSQYTLPGGKNYREVLIQEPIKKLSFEDWKTKTEDTLVQLKSTVTKLNPKQAEEGYQAYLQDPHRFSVDEPPYFKSSHWDEPNVLAHVRMNDRVTPDGKKVLFVEEIQSDWARAGREKGFLGEEQARAARLLEEKNAIVERGSMRMTSQGTTLSIRPEDQARYDEIKAELETIEKFPGDAVPSHPLLKNWQELALKKVIKKAIEGGYDYISWTTGEQQAARYSLEKNINSIQWYKSNDGKYKYIKIEPKDAGLIRIKVDQEGIVSEDDSRSFSDGEVKKLYGKHISDVIGKDIAEKILAKDEDTVSGEGLKIGGEWAKNLYDKQIPNILKDLTKGEVGSVKLKQGFIKPSETKDFNEWDKKMSDIEQPSLHITPEVRSRVVGDIPKAGGLTSRQRRYRTLSGLINSRGGIDLAKDYNVKEMKEFKVKHTAGGKTPDDWAQTLMEEGYLRVPSDKNPGDYLVEILKDPQMNKLDQEGPTAQEIKAEKQRMTEIEEAEMEFFGAPPITSENPPPTGRGGLTPPDIDFGNWKDRNALVLSLNTMERNIEAVAKDKADEINKFITFPIRENENQRVDWLNTIRGVFRDKLDQAGIKFNTEEDRLIMRFGEGRIDDEKLRLATKKWREVMELSNFFRSFYDSSLDQINQVRDKFGYDPIPKRQDYFRHYQEIGNFIDSVGLMFNQDSLPTAIAGETEFFKPGKPFTSTELKRVGGKFTESAIGGLENYLESVSKQIFHTDSVQRARLFEKYIRLSGKQGLAKLPNFVANLKEYGNLLAGKKSTFDRAFESVFGRPFYGVADFLKRRTSANMIAGNISSALMNFAPFAQSMSQINKIDSLKGMFESVVSCLNKDPLTIDGISSKFLKRRYPDPKLINDWVAQASSAASKPFQLVDFFAAKSIVAAKYYEGLRIGLTPEEAMQRADDTAGRIITDRSWGQLPNLFSSRSLGVLSQFQTEINNLFFNLYHDVPRDYQGDVKKIFSIYMQFIVLSYVWNNLYEKIMGRRPLFDPMYAAFTMAGASPDGIGRPLPERVLRALNDLRENVPFGSLGGGRFPIGAGLPDLVKASTGESTWTKELTKPVFYFLLPFGGGQIKKTIEGTHDYLLGKAETPGGKTRYYIDQNGANFIRGALFGKYAFPEAQKHYQKSGVKKKKRKVSY